MKKGKNTKIVLGRLCTHPFLLKHEKWISHCKEFSTTLQNYTVWYLFCENHKDCGGTLRALTVMRGSRRLCKSCIRIGPPYLWIYSALQNRSRCNARCPSVEFTFASFLPFMNDTHCVYCLKELAPRLPYNRLKGKRFGTPNVQLDRKDSRLPYSPDNCVSACGSCNVEKGAYFTMNEYKMIWADRRNDTQEVLRLAKLCINESKIKAPYKASDKWRHPLRK